MTGDAGNESVEYEPPTLTALGAMALTFGSFSDGVDANGLGDEPPIVVG